ncbi:cardiolipin synthase [Oceanobacillus profundus]|uniref:Cardiolipin synthase n=1 Tax=Oceanobacillus profundus TaxID=372463 RepID=A0A417YP40_9BACI|nr:cardiolipin synthase [Oceanobacillus profundus]MBR3118220.1 cardiolipin synthase [Oceanobacillus sp.]PAE30607.1 cardiolipin synthase [Paenibacillus sp. 7884-2]MCM3398785.1 cardiolipin synthase [Oceanobacillus profundus]MDO6450138.1 cardiolipin synthase [Oceanobacillus profundus]RHW35390.1 cardiolipin synthase [Oceanobacillus profundus]
MGILSFLLGLIIVLNIALGISIVFLERKDPTSSWAWLMVLLFIPIAGFILYLIFGKPISNRRIFTWDKKSRLGVKTTVQSQLRSLEDEDLHFNDEAMQEYSDLVYLLLRNDDAIFSQDNAVEIYTDGEEKFEALIQDLQKAKDHIHMQYYIMRSDELGQRLAEVLIKKANEGVDVRVLYDDMGSRSLKRSYVKRLKNAGVMVEAFFPSKLIINFKINYRNHRKLTIIDGKIGYIGGFNVGDEYLGKSRKFGYWRDTHLRVMGEAVQSLQTRFILDWNQASKNDILYDDRYYNTSTSGDVGVQIVSSGPDTEWEQIKNGYIKMIMAAKEYIYIQTPYFIPDESVKDALRIAALSGVDVKIMIPNKPDHPFVYWATLSSSGELLTAGAEVFIYQNGFLHAKTIVVDGKIASVGTANIDVRSFRLNFEVNAFLYDTEIADRLVQKFNNDIKLSTQMTKKLYDQRTIGIRFKESISRLISPVL